MEAQTEYRYTSQEVSDKFAAYLLEILKQEGVTAKDAGTWMLDNEQELGKYSPNALETEVGTAFYAEPAHDHAYRKAFYVRVSSLM